MLRVWVGVWGSIWTISDECRLMQCGGAAPWPALLCDPWDSVVAGGSLLEAYIRHTRMKL
jgi:hypothetical protein